MDGALGTLWINFASKVQIKSSGPKKFRFHAWVKSAILAIFQKSANWLDWPFPVSAVLQNWLQDFFFLCYMYFNFNLFFWIWHHCQYIVAPLELVIQIQIKALWMVLAILALHHFSKIYFFFCTYKPISSINVNEFTFFTSLQIYI